MENMNNQGKTPQQYKDSIRFFSRAILGIIILMIIMVLLGGCSLTTYPIDPCCDKDHTTEVYYYDNNVYWGYHTGYYYYYGVRHFHPWWYYYQFIPPYHYTMHSHVYIHLDNGLFVYMHRGNKFNNKKQKEYKNFDTKHSMIKNVMVDNKLSNKDYYRKLDSEVKNRNNYYKSNNNIIINNKKPVYNNRNNNIKNNNIKLNKNKVNTKVIIKTNNGSKRTNKTTIRRKPKK